MLSQFQDSVPLTVVVPDEPESIDAAIASGKSNADLDVCLHFMYCILLKLLTKANCVENIGLMMI